MGVEGWLLVLLLTFYHPCRKTGAELRHQQMLLFALSSSDCCRTKSGFCSADGEGLG